MQQTLHFDPASGKIAPLRTKEEAHDYRYFPEPDLVPVEPPAELVERLRAEIPELPGARIRRFEAEHGLPFYDAEVLNGSPALAALFEAVAGAGTEPKAASNVLMNQLAAAGVDPAVVNATELAKLIEARDSIPRKTFDAALARAGEPGFSAEPYLAEAAISDLAELEPLLERVLEANEAQVAAYRNGKEGVLGYLVGRVMQESGGKANPKIVSELLRERLRA